MVKNDVPNVNFKGFMADSAQANWNAVRAIYGDGDPSYPWLYVSVHVFSIGPQAWIR
jgi:hypothetical protein